MTEELNNVSVLSYVDNAISRRKLLGAVLREVSVPQASYDFVKSEYRTTNEMDNIIFHFFLPITRRVRRQSALIGSDFNLVVDFWTVPKSVTHKLTVVSNKYCSFATCRVRVIAPIREDRSGIVW